MTANRLWSANAAMATILEMDQWATLKYSSKQGKWYVNHLIDLFKDDVKMTTPKRPDAEGAVKAFMKTMTEADIIIDINKLEWKWDDHRGVFRNIPRVAEPPVRRS